MKYLIASDVHGSAYYMQKIIDLFNIEKADKLILLGDIYNHGPRNPLPQDYAPMKVSEMLNQMVDKLIVVKGNCDSQVDTMISSFDFVENAVIDCQNKSVFLTHGHVYNKDSKPKTKFDAVIYGHFHTCFIEKIDGTAYVNTGSVSLPKNDTPCSYVMLENQTITLKDIAGKTIESIEL